MEGQACSSDLVCGNLSWHRVVTGREPNLSLVAEQLALVAMGVPRPRGVMAEAASSAMGGTHGKYKRLFLLP